MPAPVRSAAALPQSARAFRAVSSQPLVAGLATDLKIQTQIGHRKLTGRRENYESLLLIHEGYFFPGHRPEMCNPCPRTICYLCPRIIPFEIGAGEPLVLANLELATGCERDCEGLVADGDAVLGFLICEAHQELAWRDVA